MMQQQYIINHDQLKDLLFQAARAGAKAFSEEYVLYHKNEASKMLNISFVTLQKLIKQNKIRELDGRISGREINRYLSSKSREDE